jgi:ABC-type dipeptide/oligopeptide/nickel transport system permease component
LRRGDYVIRRFGYALATLLFAVTLNFVIFRALPGDAASAQAQCEGCTAEYQAAVRRNLGLDKSKPEQYVLYVTNLAQGDLGRSFKSKQPVWNELRVPLLNTIPVVALGLLFATIVGTVTGLITTWRRGTPTDWGGLSVALAFYSLPVQWLGLMLIIAFTGILPTSGVTDPLAFLSDPSIWDQAVDRLEHMILPSLTLGLVLFGTVTLILRSALLDTLGEDYILTARAKGLRPWAIVWRHAFPNALLPTMTVVALWIGLMAGGAILVETVFSYPGIGLELFDAVAARDFPVLQGAFLILTVSVIFANLVADLLYAKLDPRVS